MSDKHITIREVAEKFNLTPDTINHYTNLGLLKVVSRKRNRRLYDEENVRRRLKKIEELVSRGYPLQLISKKLNNEDV